MEIHPLAGSKTNGQIASRCPPPPPPPAATLFQLSPSKLRRELFFFRYIRSTTKFCFGALSLYWFHCSKGGFGEIAAEAERICWKTTCWDKGTLMDAV